MAEPYPLVPVSLVGDRPAKGDGPRNFLRRPRFRLTGEGVSLFVSARAGGAVFCCEFLLGDVEFRHRRLEVVVLEFLWRDPGVLFDLLGLGL